MTYVVPTAVRRRILERLLEETWTVRLFTNAHTPGERDTAASYMEASFPGYQPRDIAPWTWVFDDATASAARLVFQLEAQLSGEAAIFGYYATSADGSLGWALRFSDGPYRLRNDGDNVRVVPGLALGRME